MNNNDTLRRIRYTFEYSDAQMIELFGMGGLEVTRAEVSDWLKKEDDPEYKELEDEKLATFLNGFIIEKRGKKDGPQPAPEKKLNNNIILRKLKIALNLKDEDILEILELVRFRLGKAELSAFFRKPDHHHYRVCQDQILRNFLHGMQLKYHD
ncbi:YehS family protein [Pontibacter sp. CAU 1760]